MKGILFKPEVWEAKLKVLEQYGEAQTRRLIKQQPTRGVICKCPGDDVSFANFEMYNNMQTKTGWIPIGKVFKSPCQVGEVVYINEAWVTEKKYDHLKPGELPDSAYIHFISLGVGDYPLGITLGKLRSAMFLPERFARYFIQIADVKHQRLQEITEEGAVKEGMNYPDIWNKYFPHYGEGETIVGVNSYVNTYRVVWDSINPKNPWASNDWVWVYSFKKVNNPKEDR